MKKVLDTNAVLYLLGGKLAEPLSPGRYFISVISEMELLSYFPLDDAAIAQIRAFISTVVAVDLTQEIKELAVTLRRQHALKLPDAIIAATALSLEAELVTNDTKLLRVPNLPCEHLKLA